MFPDQTIIMIAKCCQNRTARDSSALTGRNHPFQFSFKCLQFCQPATHGSKLVAGNTID